MCAAYSSLEAKDQALVEELALLKKTMANMANNPSSGESTCNGLGVGSPVGDDAGGDGGGESDDDAAVGWTIMRVVAALLACVLIALPVVIPHRMTGEQSNQLAYKVKGGGGERGGSPKSIFRVECHHCLRPGSPWKGTAYVTFTPPHVCFAALTLQQVDYWFSTNPAAKVTALGAATLAMLVGGSLALFAATAHGFEDNLWVVLDGLGFATSLHDEVRKKPPCSPSS